MEHKQEGPDHTEQQPGEISGEKSLEHGLAGIWQQNIESFCSRATRQLI